MQIFILIFCVIAYLAFSFLTNGHPQKENSTSFISDTQVMVAEAKPIFNERLPDQEPAMAERAFDIFCKTCPNLMNKNKEHIEWIRVNHGFYRTKPAFKGDDGYWPRGRMYGWDKEIEIQVKIKEHTNLMAGSITAQGHILYFWLGGPVNSGISIPKFPILCGAERQREGYDAFIPVPELSFIKLDNPPPPVEGASRNPKR